MSNWKIGDRVTFDKPNRRRSPSSFTPTTGVIVDIAGDDFITVDYGGKDSEYVSASQLRRPRADLKLRRAPYFDRFTPEYEILRPIIYGKASLTPIGETYRTGTLRSCFRWYAVPSPEFRRSYRVVTGREWDDLRSRSDRGSVLGEFAEAVAEYDRLGILRRSYLALADELNDLDVGPYVEEDWNAGTVYEATAYAEARGYPFPPTHGTFEWALEEERAGR